MIHLVTYHNAEMNKSARICKESWLRNGVDKVWQWTRAAIEQTEFFERNKQLLSISRGDGLWAWKPYIILEAMNKAKENDIIVYSDVGVEAIASIRHVIDRMDQDIWLFSNMFKHVSWVKGIVMDTILPEWRDGRYDNLNQVQASVIVLKNTEWVRSFIDEWVELCQQPELIDDSPSSTPNHPAYSEGRHDQGILCSLQIKYGLRLHYWAAIYNCGAFRYEKGAYKDTYPLLFHHHRSRDILWSQKDDLSRTFQRYFGEKYGALN